MKILMNLLILLSHSVFCQSGAQYFPEIEAKDLRIGNKNIYLMKDSLVECLDKQLLPYDTVKAKNIDCIELINEKLYISTQNDLLVYQNNILDTLNDSELNSSSNRYGHKISFDPVSNEILFFRNSTYFYFMNNDTLSQKEIKPSDVYRLFPQSAFTINKKIYFFNRYIDIVAFTSDEADTSLSIIRRDNFYDEIKRSGYFESVNETIHSHIRYKNKEWFTTPEGILLSFDGNSFERFEQPKKVLLNFFDYYRINIFEFDNNGDLWIEAEGFLKDTIDNEITFLYAPKRLVKMNIKDNYETFEEIQIDHIVSEPDTF